ncbi:hypothetical protein C4Q28_24525 [Pseudomonas sp. SWI6]|nr:hypothetical protein C4Q28_24525 [Pseudomonas sp. SWI6]
MVAVLGRAWGESRAAVLVGTGLLVLVIWEKKAERQLDGRRDGGQVLGAGGKCQIFCVRAGNGLPSGRP